MGQHYQLFLDCFLSCSNGWTRKLDCWSERLLKPHSFELHFLIVFMLPLLSVAIFIRIFFLSSALFNWQFFFLFFWGGGGQLKRILTRLKALEIFIFRIIFSKLYTIYVNSVFYWRKMTIKHLNEDISVWVKFF